MKERVINLLSEGYKTSEVSSILGISPGYVSQVLKENQEQITALIVSRVETSDHEALIEKKVEKVEHKVFDAIMNACDGAELPQLSVALRAITDYKRHGFERKHPAAARPFGAGAVTQINQINVTQIALPAHISAPVVSLNEQKEIIAINGQILAPMSTDGVKNLFNQMDPLKRNTPVAVETIDMEPVNAKPIEEELDF